MATQALPFLTPEQYLEIERAAEFRSEYLNGEMFAMSGASVRHGDIVNNLAAIFRAQVRGRCRYYTTDLRLLIPATGLFTYPDLVVMCGEILYSGDREDIVTNPVVVGEVLSKSTANYDRGGKFFHYRSIPSLKDYLIIAQDSARVEHHAKQSDGSWLLREYSSLDDVVRITSITVEIGLRALYEDVALGNGPSELEIDERDR
jgi:Uma2 family endonuclease